MGAACTRTALQAIPDRVVMLDVVERIVAFEDMLKRGEALTRVQETEKRELDRVAAAMSRVQRKEKTLVRGVHVRVE